MRPSIFILITMGLMQAGISSALPPIVIMNYTPPTPAFALVSMTPANHASLDTSPPAVKLLFSQNINPDKSELKIYDPYNNLLSTTDKAANPSGMSALLPTNLLAGTYRVEWKAVCICTSNTQIGDTDYFTIY
jgi:methionine-rich copper-binding protein CopC